MVDIPRSSFIPKEKSTAVPNRIQARRTFGVFNFIATTALIISLIGAGGVFVYKKTVSSALTQAGQDLAEQKGLFKDDQIIEVRMFDKKLRAAEYLLKNHIAPSKILSALESTTMQRVQFTGFALEYQPGLEVILTLKGATQEFKTVALQSLQFGKEGSLLKDAVFKDVGSASAQSQAKAGQNTTDTANTTNNQVQFTVKGSVGLGLLAYDGTHTPANQPDNQQPQNTEVTTPNTTTP